MLSFITQQRLHNQLLTQHPFKKIEDVVRHMGAVQAQDYPAAKWAIGVRMNGITDADVEKAINDGKILRTHVMRPTWHLVAPEDLGWMQKLTGARVKRILKYYDERQDVNGAAVAKAEKIITKALRGTSLTKKELGEKLKSAGFKLKLNQLAHYVMHAELDGTICSGPRNSKIVTYALTEERIKKEKQLDRDESIAELTKRYFTSHGPALLQDFNWWSGLPMGDIRRGVQLIGNRLQSETIGKKTFYFYDIAPKVKNISNTAFLLPNYDEYGVAYRHREEMLHPGDLKTIVFSNPIFAGGQLVGAWKKTQRASGVKIDTKFIHPVTPIQKTNLNKEITRLRKFWYPEK